MDYDKIADPIEIKPIINLDCAMENTVGRYKLYAIVHHYGSKGNGHYITEALDLSQMGGAAAFNQSLSGQDGSTQDWYRCDDETITKMSSPPSM